MLRTVTLAALTAVLLPVAAAPAVAAPAVRQASSLTVVATSPATYQAQVLALTNAERRARGLRALTLSACADRFADRWAGRLRGADSLSHQPLGPVVSGCRARAAGENVGYGNVTADQLVRMWLDSPPHRANLLAPDFTRLGVGALSSSTGRWFGVQVFLRV